jgi:hypothetical protein
MSTIRANNFQGLDAANPAIELPADGTLIVASGFSGDLESKGTFVASGLTVESTATFAVGASGTPAIAASGDANTGIYFPAADTIGFTEGGNEAARIDNEGRLLVGTSSSTNASANCKLVVNTNGAAARFEGTVGYGLDVVYTTVPANGDDLGLFGFKGYTTGTTEAYGAWIMAEADGAWASGNARSRLVFSTTADGTSSPTERMRITNDGTLKVGTTSATPANCSIFTRSNSSDFGIVDQPTTSVGYPMGFYNSSGTGVGYIETTASATNYVTSSDYRLKENVVPLTGAADRINQLQVHRFNFIVDPDTTFDGFLAHEAQAVVPEAVSGTHNEVEVWKEGEELPDGVSVGDAKLDEDGNTIPVYQGIDQSKLVPLLTAALQEALAEIESLKARVTALEP